MNLQMLGAMGPGIQEGQAAQAQLADVIQQHQIRAKALQDQQAAEQASRWMQGGGLAAALSGLAQPVPGGASPAAMPGPLPSPVAAPSGGGIGGPVNPSAVAPPPPPAPPVTAAAPGTGAAYSEPALDKLTRLLIGEAGGEDDRGQQAVAAVVRNRADQSGMSLEDVIGAPKQFEPVGNAKRWAELQTIPQDHPAYIRARANAMRILQGEAPDPTGGADHFYSPSAQDHMGRPKPTWDNGSGTDMGRHRFFKLGYKGTGPTGEPAGVDAAATTPDAAPAPDPSEPDYGHDYTPMDSLRMTMQLADFIGQRYKEQTGEDLPANLLMDQVERVAKLSNQFTGAQRLAVQNGLGVLRAQTSLIKTDKQVAGAARNTDVRTGTQLTIAEGHDNTSRANTKDRGETARVVGAAHDATSSGNNQNTNQTRRDLAVALDARERELGVAKLNVQQAIAAGRDATAERNSVRAAESRVAAARALALSASDAENAAPAGQAGTVTPGDAPKSAAAAPAPAAKPAARVDPVKPKGAQKPAGAPANAKQAPDGKWYSPDPARPGKYLRWQ